MKSEKPILFLHGGTHKTGTTSIQFFLKTNFEILLSDSILYPFTGRDTILQHHYLFSALRKPISSDFPPKKNFKGYIADLKDEILKYNPNKVVLSSEVFFESFISDPDNFREKLNEMFNLFSKVHIILYIRRPDLFGISNNNSMIVNKNRKEHQLAFTKIFKLIDAFEKEMLIIRPFEKGQFEDGNLINDFLSILNIEHKEKYINSDNNHNASVDIDLVELFRLINNAHLELAISSKYKKSILNAFNSHQKSTKSFFSPQDRLTIINQYAIEFENLARNFLGREDGKFFYDPLPETNDTWESYKGLPIDTVVQTFSYLLFRQQEQLNIQALRISEIEEQLKVLKEKNSSI
jgi:hypothetical protein